MYTSNRFSLFVSFWVWYCFLFLCFYLSLFCLIYVLIIFYRFCKKLFKHELKEPTQIKSKFSSIILNPNSHILSSVVRIYNWFCVTENLFLWLYPRNHNIFYSICAFAEFYIFFINCNASYYFNFLFITTPFLLFKRISFSYHKFLISLSSYYSHSRIS